MRALLIWFRNRLPVLAVLLASCSHEPAVVYRATSPNGKITIHAETRNRRLDLREMPMSFSTESNITQIWFGWSHRGDAISVVVCDAVGGPKVIRHSLGGSLDIDFRETDRALVESLRATFGRNAGSTDHELLWWFCDAPGQEAFARKFRPAEGGAIQLPSQPLGLQKQ